MNYRMTEIWPEHSYTTDQTVIIDLNLMNPVSQIIVDADCYNGSETAITGHPVKGITKIELVDGSDVLYSLSGVEGHAVDFYHNKRERQAWFHYMGSNYTDYAIGLNFGRFLWDPLYALDPSKFRNLQLKITLDIDGGGGTPTTIRLRVTANVFDEKSVTPAGFLMHKEMKSYTLEDSAHEYSDLPTDYPYRKLFVRAQRYGTEANQQLESIKITEDNDRKVVINQKVARVMRNLIALTPAYKEGILLKGATTTRNFYCTPTATVYGVGGRWATAVAAGAVQFNDGDGGRFAAIVGTAGGYVHYQIHGWLPHGVFEFPFGIQNDPEDWYDVSKIGSLIIDVEAASSVGSSQTCQVLLQQARKY